MPPNKRLVEPGELEKLCKELQASHGHAVAADKTGNVKRYVGATWLIALQSSSDDSMSESSSSSDESSSSDSDEDTAVPTLSDVAQLCYSSCDELYSAEVVIDAAAASEIPAETKLQASSQPWFVECRKRLTASLCKQIVCRQSEDFTLAIQAKLSGTFKGNRATRYGQKHESIALGQYCHKQQQQEGSKIEVCQSGLVVSQTWPFLAASPDGIVHSKVGRGLVEVKCPYSCRDLPLSAATAKPSNFLKQCDGALRLKRTHAYYYQVQFQMLVTGFDWVDFVVWTPSELHIERISKEEHFNEKCLPKVKKFYFEFLLPALLAECI